MTNSGVIDRNKISHPDLGRKSYNYEIHSDIINYLNLYS